jgi:hypothetical protein
LKLKHINLQEYPNYKDISHIGLAVCDSAVVDDEGNPRVQDEVIKKGQLLESLDADRFFSGLHCTSPSTILCGQVKQRHMVHHKMPNFKLQLGCMATSYKNEIHQWRVLRLKQPYTCGTSEV